MLALATLALSYPTAPVPVVPEIAHARPMNLSQYKNNETVMIVVPHPDDMESGAGGTISYLTAQGTRVVLMVLTVSGLAT